MDQDFKAFVKKHFSVIRNIAKQEVGYSDWLYNLCDEKEYFRNRFKEEDRVIFDEFINFVDDRVRDEACALCEYAYERGIKVGAEVKEKVSRGIL